MAEKVIYYANFNLTFGDKEEPMLEHFLDIIYPALKSNFKRGNEEKGDAIFTIEDVEIKKFDNEIVLVGNFIKDTKYVIRTSKENGKLKSTPGTVSTAPFSRIIIFLRNHRMVLIKNESKSPDIKSFQKTVLAILAQYGAKVKQEKGIKLPYVNVDIVEMKFKEDIESVIESMQKINFLRLRFFPLNNDNDQVPLTQAIKREMDTLEVKRSHIEFKSPGSKKGVKNLVTESLSNGLAYATVDAVDEYGQPIKIMENSFTSKSVIEMGNDRDINGDDDYYIYNHCSKKEIIKKTSQDNESLFNKFKNKIKELIL